MGEKVGEIGGRNLLHGRLHERLGVRMFKKIARYWRAVGAIVGSHSGYWLGLFALGIGLALLWTAVPLYLSPLGIGLGHALFPQPAFVLTYFGACAASMAVRSLAAGEPLDRMFSLGVPQAVLGTAGGFLLVAANVLGGASGFEGLGGLGNFAGFGGVAGAGGVDLPGTTGMVIEWEREVGPSAAEVAVLAIGCAGAACVGFTSACVVLWASRMLKSLSTARALVALTGAFAVAGALTVVCAFVDWWPVVLLFACVPLLTYLCSHAADRRIPYADLEHGAEGALALGSIDFKHAWRYALVFGSLFLMGGYVLSYAGTYNHLPQGLPLGAALVQSAGVFVLMLVAFCAMQAVPKSIGYALICRVCVPPIALAMVLIFVPERNSGYLDDAAVCLTFLALMACDLTSWIVDVCGARSRGAADNRVFALVRCGMFMGVLLSCAVMSYPWAPLDKPKVGMAIALAALVVAVTCLPTAEARALSFASSKPLSLRALDEEQRGRWSGVIVERGLTAREAEVFLLMVRELDAPAIAEELSVSRATVNTHVQHIYRKFGVHGRKELLAVLEG